jgi:FKBP-type peptidyl-prolyl cis-trans isomerase
MGKARTMESIRPMKTRYLLLLAPVLFAACSEDPVAVQREACNLFLQSYTAAIGDTVTTEEGVRYIDIEVGVGPGVTWGDVPLMDFSGYFVSGTAFDTSCGLDGQPFAFQLGDERYLPGFQYGIIGMQLTGIRRMILPLDLGYVGDTEERIFDVHMLNVLN